MSQWHFQRQIPNRRILRIPVLSWVVFFAWMGICETVANEPNVEPNVEAAATHVSQIIAHRGASVERPECTLAAIRRAIEVGATAVEVDVRTSRDGELFILHDTTLDRTTNGTGLASDLTLVELQQLDAGSWFGPAFRSERIPSLIQVVQACRGRIHLLLDLKEQGVDYDHKVVAMISKQGDPGKTIVGVRSVAQAMRYRSMLPDAQQLALIPSVDSIEDFAKAGVDTIRLWPRWIQDSDEPVKRVRAAGTRLHLNGTLGEVAETIQLLAFEPDSLSSDDPARLNKTLERIAVGDTPDQRLPMLIARSDGTQFGVSELRIGVRSFLNRDYQMLDLPGELVGLPRYVFNGGEGADVRLRFRKPAVVFAAFDYNDTGLWSFEDGLRATEFGWHLWRQNAYRGSSNAQKDGQPHQASIWFREFKPGQELSGMPAWWLCLGVTDLPTAIRIDGFKPGLTSDAKPLPSRFSHVDTAARNRPLAVPPLDSLESLQQWQRRQRAEFVDRMLYRYDGEIAVVEGPAKQFETHRRREFMVTLDSQRLFRFFRLEPDAAGTTGPLPTIVCFMGHGKVAQILDQQESYQHACATNFAKAGFLVFAMENIGMEPGRDRHHDLDQALRLDGHGWYSLLFAHQRILLDRVFADPGVDPRRVATTGVSTGGLLALTAAAMEPRIAAASVQGIFGSMRNSFIRDADRHCSCGAIAGLLPEFDLPELAVLAAPLPLHISNGQSDGFSPVEASRCIDLVTPLFHRMGASKPTLTISAGGHEYAFAPALEFLADRLSGPLEAAAESQEATRE